jgi:hypothetical protein
VNGARRVVSATVVGLTLALLGACSGSPDKVVQVTQYNQGQGVPLYVSGDASRLAGAPKDFQKFMAARVRSAIEFDDGTCDEPAVYSVKAIATSGHAAGELSQCGVESIIWARGSGGWKQIWSGDGEPPCDALKKYDVPHGIAGQSCRDGDGSKMYRG